MSLPGFTAEASIYGSGKRYRGMGSASLTGGKEVIPQRFCYWDGLQILCCDESGCRRFYQ